MVNRNYPGKRDGLLETLGAMGVPIAKREKDGVLIIGKAAEEVETVGGFKV